MNYRDLKNHCNLMRLSLFKVAEEVGLSYDGLKKGVANGSLAMRHIPKLCQSLCITPNQFFGIEEVMPSIQQVQNGGSNNQQIIEGAAITALRQQIVLKDSQLAEKDKQLAEKDKQISKLLDMLAK